MIKIPKKLLKAGFPNAYDERYALKWDDDKQKQHIGFNSVRYHLDIGKWVLENISSIEYMKKRSTQ